MKPRAKYWTCSADVLFVRRDVRTHDCVAEPTVAEAIVAERPKLEHRSTAADAARRLLGDLAVEAVVVIMLDSCNAVIGACRLAVGIPDQCTVFPRTIFTAALLSGAAEIIVAHNHPGGTPQPSESDWALTRRLRSAGTALDLPLIDHLIITDTTCTSMCELPRW
jgi:DNA repair protein RadC